MKYFITALIFIIPFVGNAQKVNDINLQNMGEEAAYQSLSQISSNIKSSYFPLDDKPDSTVCYADTLETERIMMLTHTYHEDSIVIISYWYDADTLNYSVKEVHYMDNNLPDLLFEPLFSGGRKGSKASYEYEYITTIGDTLAISFLYDFNTKTYVPSSKTFHNISSEGIDTLATSYLWDDDAKSWELNNIVKQKYINGNIDTLKVLMLAKDLTDTLNYDVITYKYNENNQIVIEKDRSPVSCYSVDSILYNNDLVDFIFYLDNGDPYYYAEQYFYDSINRAEKIVYWDKQGGLVDSVYDGHLRFYYSEQTPVETSLVSSEKASDLYIYPNPCSEYLKVTGYSGKVEVYNSIGQIMLQQDIVSEGTINTSLLSKGLYIVKLGNTMKQVIVSE